ncbi:MAG: class I SAM-dependent methyltransferase [Thioalkalivibrio sp.]|nr:class I SAM-dependent methyltransferase [Thioalkalivibrio sp.]
MKQIHHTDCPLCRSSTMADFAEAHGRTYGECATCGLIAMEANDRPDRATELAQYGLHQNDPADAGYRSFLSRLADPLSAQLTDGAEGLDYGSGPGPTLSVMLKEQGFHLQLYDPFFAPGVDVLNRTYDFITCTETVEHFFSPAAEFERLDRMLRPGGWLGIMTEVYTNRVPFAQWRYARDPTHTCFYRPETMAWIAARFGYWMREPHPTVRLFQKPLTPPPAGADE